MIDLGSIAGLYEHELRAYRLRCNRWAMLPLGELVSQGKESLRLPIAVRCKQCGEVGRIQVRPPMPAWTNRNGWLEFRQRRNPGAGPGFEEAPNSSPHC